MASPQRLHFPYSPLVDDKRMVEDEWRDWLGRGWNDLRSFVQAINFTTSPPLVIPTSAFTPIGGWTKSIDNNTLLHPAGDFNAATGVFTAPLYGLYMAYCYFLFATPIPAANLVAALLAGSNGQNIQATHAGGGAGSFGSDAQVTGMFNLAPGQTITPQVFQSSGGNATLQPGQISFNVWQVQ